LPGASDPFDEPWTSGIFKSAVEGPVALSVDGFAGDGHADLVNHGGPDKAVCVYVADHYDRWRQALGVPALPSGAFGENLTVQGLDEHTVCIGDIWTIGGPGVAATATLLEAGTEVAHSRLREPGHRKRAHGLVPPRPAGGPGGDG
jgi:MOSC domain-containing protein YiiM